MKYSILLILSTLSIASFAQVKLSGKAKSLDHATTDLTITRLDSENSFHIVIQNNDAEVQTSSARLTIEKTKGFLLKDETGISLLKTTKTNFLSETETFNRVTLKGYTIAVANKEGQIVAKAKYNMLHDTAEIIIEMDSYNEPLAIMIGFEIGHKIQKMAQGNVTLLTLAGTL